MSLIKNIISGIMRCLVYTRIRRLPLRESDAEFWTNIFKKYPSVFPPGGERQWKQLPDGFLMDLGIVDHIERNLLLNATWDDHVGNVIRRVLKKGDTFLDIGANIGFFSLLASELVGENGRVIAVEPSPRVLSRLSLHIDSNHASQISILSLGAGSDYSHENLVLATASNTGGSSIHQQEGNRPVESILVVPLGKLLSKLKIRPALIKMDVEGFELFALEGLAELLVENVPIICEVTEQLLHRHGQSVEQMMNFMSTRGYFAYWLETDQVESLKIINDDFIYPNYQFDVLFSPDSPKQLFEKYGLQVTAT